MLGPWPSGLKLKFIHCVQGLSASIVILLLASAEEGGRKRDRETERQRSSEREREREREGERGEREREGEISTTQVRKSKDAMVRSQAGGMAQKRVGT